jgi:hypothetical protein
MKKLLVITLLVAVLILGNTLALALPDNDDNGIMVLGIEPAISPFSTQDNQPDLILVTNVGNKPVYIDEEVYTDKLTKDEFTSLLNEAYRSMSIINDDNYELVIFDEENGLAYIYQNVDQSEQIIISPLLIEKKGASALEENSVIMPLAGNLNDNEFKPGLGCRARTFNTSIQHFNAQVYNTNANIGTGSSGITLYSYIGFTGINVNMETDLGVQYSPTYNSWSPYFLVNRKDIGEITTTLDADYKNNYAFRYYGNSSSNKLTLTIDKYYNYNGERMVKLVVSGKQINNTNGTSEIIGGTGTANTVQYKLVSSVAANNRDNIKSGTSLKSYWSNANINGSAVSSYSQAIYSQYASIPTLTSSSVVFNISR